MSKRYQVFVSSTYADLRNERQRVMQTLMELDCIPAGMELFPATDEEQLLFIKRVIDDCDYYVLIIGGRYGSLTREGISFTEQEFDYAVSRGVPVIAFIHEAPDEIAFGKSEHDPELRVRLEGFRKKVGTGRLVRYWRVAEDLPGLVALSISKTIKAHPAVGWVRADRAANEDVLFELNEVRKQNADLSQKLAIAEKNVIPMTPIRDLAALEEIVTLNGTGTAHNRQLKWSVEVTWADLFALIAPYLVKHPNETFVKKMLDEALSKGTRTELMFKHLDDQDFQTIGVQLRALGLITMNYTKTVQGGMGLFWSATPEGEALMFKLRAVRTSPKSNGSVS